MVSGAGLQRHWMNVKDFLYQLPDEQKQASINWDKVTAAMNNLKQRGLFDRNCDPIFTVGNGTKNRKKIKALVCIHDGASDTPYGVVWSPKSKDFHQFQDVQAKEINIEKDSYPGLAGVLNWTGIFGAATDTKNANDLANYIPPTSLPEAMTYPDAKQ